MVKMSAMENRTPKIPGPDHPISITAAAQHIVVSVADRVIADTRGALALREASYPVVHYIPRADVKMDLLEKTEHKTYCPYKGECSYYSIPSGGQKSVNAIWSYEHPYPAVGEIEGFLAFYRDRVDSMDVIPLV
jgi:uncharacterized protein (DUF427 family)